MNATLDQWRQNDYYNEYRDLAWRTAVTQRYNISLSQKIAGNNHFVSFNYEHNKNRALNDQGNSFAVYWKSTFKLAKWLNVKVGIDSRITNSTSPEGAYTSYNKQERYARIKDADGNLVYTPYGNTSGYAGSALNGSAINAVATTPGFKPYTFNVLESLDEGLTDTRAVRVRPFINLEAKFLVLC